MALNTVLGIGRVLLAMVTCMACVTVISICSRILPGVTVAVTGTAVEGCMYSLELETLV